MANTWKRRGRRWEGRRMNEEGRKGGKGTSKEGKGVKLSCQGTAGLRGSVATGATTIPVRSKALKQHQRLAANTIQKRNPMNSTRSYISVFCIGFIFLLGANGGRCVEFCFPNAANNYCQSPPPPPDTTPPTVSVLPLRGANALKVPQVVLMGNASDANGINRVMFRVENYYGNSDWQGADGVNVWTASVTGLAGGQNTIRIRAFDGAGNFADVLQSVFYIQKVPLTVTVTGSGTMTPNLAGTMIEVGKYYTVTAKPAKGYAFANWTGDQAANSASLEFLMLTNTVLQANFVPTPFGSAVGKYTGAITALVSGPPQLAGSIKIKITRTGAFTAKFQLGDKAYPLSGVFLADGSYSGIIYRKQLPNNPVKVQLQLDIDGQTINGSLTDTSWSSEPTGAFSAVMQNP